MPITFDTLEELKEFYRNFQLDEKPGKSIKGKSSKVRLISPKSSEGNGAGSKKPGRKPKSAATATKTAVKRGPKPKNTSSATKPPAKRGPKPKTGSPAAKAASTAKVGRPRSNAGTLTAMIKSSIQSFLDKNKSFTANDIYADISSRDKTVNKQSVITSVLKQMNTTFSNIKVTERPGAGPRPVKLYNP